MSKKSDKDFIEKLKSITIGTGAKNVPKCPDCGGPMHLKGFAVVVERERPKPPREEQSFSA